MQTTTPSKVALVSGAGRGIGHAVARALVEAGWRVSVGTRQHTDAFADLEPERIHQSMFDAEEPGTEAVWVRETVDRWGRIDGLVHNAGIASWQSVIEASADEVDRLFEVNVKSPLRLTQAAWPQLATSGDGKVVVIASLAAKRVRVPEASLYSMSKAAVLALAHGIRLCGEPDRVRCTAICPGFVATDMANNLPAEVFDQSTRPEDIAILVRTVMELPFRASISEIPINWRAEPLY